jgi:DNA polymerase elongation subunit (family B)
MINFLNANIIPVVIFFVLICVDIVVTLLFTKELKKMDTERLNYTGRDMKDAVPKDLMVGTNKKVYDVNKAVQVRESMKCIHPTYYHDVEDKDDSSIYPSMMREFNLNPTLNHTVKDLDLSTMYPDTVSFTTVKPKLNHDEVVDLVNRKTQEKRDELKEDLRFIHEQLDNGFIIMSIYGDSNEEVNEPETRCISLLKKIVEDYATQHNIYL